MSSTIRGGNAVNINIQTGEKLILDTITGTFTATIIAGVGTGTVLATDSSGGGSFGPYASAVVICVKTSADGLTDFEVGTAPDLDYAVPVTAKNNALTGKVGIFGPDGQEIVVGSVDTRPSAETTATVLVDDIQSPLEIPNCELWLDAQSGPVTSAWVDATEGQTVATWLDNSGNARHATPQAGTPVFKVSEGYGGKSGVKIGANCRLITPAFITSAYGNALTIFLVSKEDASLHSSLKIKLSITTANIYYGNTGTTGARDCTITGLTGFTGFGESSGNLGGIDYLAVGPSAVRGAFDAVSANVSSSASADSVAISGGTVAYTNGAVVIGGLSATATFDWPGTVSEVLVFSRTLSTSELRRVCTYLSKKWESKKTVTIIGNSLISGTGSTGGANQTPASTGTNVPSRLIAALGANYRVRTDAYPGRTSAQIYAESPKYSGVTTDTLGAISVVWEGTNTLSTTGSAVKAYDDLRRVCLLRRRTGRKVLVGTVLLRGDSGNDTRNAAQTAKLNALIKANWSSFADAICLLDEDSRLQNFNNTTYFSGDKTHLTDAGYQVVSDLLAPIILSM